MTTTIPVFFTVRMKTVNPLNGAQGFSKNAAFAAARMRKQQRATLRLFMLSKLGYVRMPCVVMMRRVAPSAGLDDDSLPATMKSVRDGIADALEINDRDPRVRWEYDQRRGKPKEYAVEVEIRMAA